MASVEPRYWGLILHLNRDEGCAVARGSKEAETLLLAIPEPFGSLVRSGIALHKAVIGMNTGTEGIDIHFNWAGFAHWFGRIGSPQTCQPATLS